MNNFIDNIKEYFYEINQYLIKKDLIKNFENFSKISFEIPENIERGDISTNASLIYQRYSKLNAYEISNIIKNLLLKKNNIIKVEIAGPGFINIFLSNKFFLNELKKLNKYKNNYGLKNLGKNQKINIEFVSANPTGPLHVAHARGAVFGDVLSNLLKFVGYDVTREYYVNDSGSQIKILGESLFLRYLQELKLKIDKIESGYYPGEYLIIIAKKLLSKHGNKWVKVEEKKRRKFFENFATKEILKNIKKDLKDIGIKFDKFTSEKNIEKNKIINLVFKKLAYKKLLYTGKLEKPRSDTDDDWESREQLLFKSTLFNDDIDRPFVKSNNEWTYFANDAAYHFDKIKRNYKKLINVWGSDHIGYIKRMKAIVKVLSNNKIDLNIKICQLVHLKKNNVPIKMSKRSGNFVTISELVDKVGSDAIRFFMLHRKNDAQMDFDLKKVVDKNKDNSIFYVQYAYARSSSVIKLANKKFNKFNFNEININSYNKYISSHEREIIKKILSWPHIVQIAAQNEEPHKIIYYLEDLSSMFHSFWNKGKEDKSLRFIDNDINKTIIKVFWLYSMQIIFDSALKIIGIKPLKKM